MAARHVTAYRSAPDQVGTPFEAMALSVRKQDGLRASDHVPVTLDIAERNRQKGRAKKRGGHEPD